MLFPRDTGEEPCDNAAGIGSGACRTVYSCVLHVHNAVSMQANTAISHTLSEKALHTICVMPIVRMIAASRCYVDSLTDD